MTQTTQHGDSQSDLRGKLVDSIRTIERLQKALVARRSMPAEPVAIIGLGCRLPGGVKGPDSLWRLLRSGGDAIGEFPADRADARAYFAPDPDAPGKAYVTRGGFLDEVDRFEPAAFGISPREALGMDPQQRITLEVAWEALERAGYAPDSLGGSATGVFLGVSTTDYARLRQQVGDIADVDAYQLIGEPSFIAGRISFTLGLQGPSKVIDTTCSSSLVALHDACQALWLRECDMALAGGVNLMLTPYGFVMMSKFRGLSPEGRCKTFDVSADGYVRGEGAGVVVLKRLKDAQRDGDTVWAVVRGTAVNHDGRSSGITVPNPASQQAVIRAALARAGLGPEQIAYVEAHGTGTSLGDPIELRALEAVIGRHHTHESPLLVGSVKTNIGHLESAAGVAGLLKLVLALRHQEIPPHLHFKEPNPNVDWGGLHIRVTGTAHPWPVGSGPRAGAVSSFGASGTNAHAVVTEAPPAAERATGQARPWNVLTLSARSDSALVELARAYARQLCDRPDTRLSDVCWTSHVGRSRMARGIAVGADSVGELARGLAAFAAGERDDAVVTGTLAPYRSRKVAWLFTGQGSQYAGMGQALRDEPAYREALDRVTALLDPLLDRPLSEVLDLPDADSPLHRTGYTQPALFAVEYALAQLWLSWGLRPDAVMGHSVGEITAACVAGVLDLEDAVTLVAARARLMQALPAGGVMATVVCDEERAARAIAGHAGTVSIAAVNGPADTVVAGRAEDVTAVTAALARAGVKHRLLRVSHAFHSPLMAPVLDDLRKVTEGITHHSPRVPIVSNVTGTRWNDAMDDPGYWLRHAMSAVRFRDGVRTLYDEGFRTFLEIGPQPVLLGLGARGLDADDCAWIPSLRRGHDDRQRVMTALGTLHLRGAAVDWAAFHRDEEVRRIPLPTYHWEGERYWFRAADPAATGNGTASAPADEAVPGLGRRLRSSVPTYELALDEGRWARHGTGDGGAAVGVGLLVETALSAAADALGRPWTHAERVTVHEPLTLGDGTPRSVHLAVEVDGDDGAVFSYRSLTDAEEAAGAPWRLHARGTLRRQAPPQDLGLPPAPTDAGMVVEIDVPEGDGGTPGLAELLEAATAAVLGAAAAGGADGPVEGVAVGCDAVSRPVTDRVARIRLHTVPDGDEGGAWARVEFLSAQGRALGGVNGLHVLPGSAAAAGRGAPWHHPNELMFRLDWREAEQGAVPDPDGDGYLLVADRGGAAERLAREFGARGAHCTLVSPPQAPPGEDRPYADEMRLLLDQWRTWTARPTRIVVLSSLDTPGLDDATTDTLTEYRDRAELLAVGLVQALGLREDLPGVRVSTVTRGAMPAAPGQPTLDAVANTVWGLGRVIALEHPERWGGAVDLDPACGDPAHEAARLADALLTTGDEDQQALRGERRLVCRLVPHRPDRRELRAAPRVREDGTYLITGAFGGIGTALARWLARHGAGRLVLLGRTALPDHATWDSPDLPDAVRARVAVVRELEATGVRVEVVAADVADAAAMRSLAGRLADGLCPLRGVVHAAGVSVPQFVRDVRPAEYDAVWRPKVLGGRALHQATCGMDLDFFLGFSSIAATWGSQHLASYAAANAFLDGLAHHRRARGLPALTVDWGPWELASSLFGDDVLQFLKATGLRPLSAPQCLKTLGALLAGDDAQQVVCAADWSVYRPVMEARIRRPLLDLIDADAGETGRTGPAPVLEELLRTAPAEREALLDRYLREQLAQILRVDVARLAGEFHLLEMGLDSLMVMELVSRTRKDLRIDFAGRDFFATDANLWAGFLLRQVINQHEADPRPRTAADAA
ncbi:hypothetical protein GCM10027168_22970 [Streptomyces capparidis]